MKIVEIDNYDRETVPDRLVAENVGNGDEANIMCEALNNFMRARDKYFVVKPDDYKLWRGVEEFI